MFARVYYELNEAYVFDDDDMRSEWFYGFGFILNTTAWPLCLIAAGFAFLANTAAKSVLAEGYSLFSLYDNEGSTRMQSAASCSNSFESTSIEELPVGESRADGVELKEHSLDTGDDEKRSLPRSQPTCKKKISAMGLGLVSLLFGIAALVRLDWHFHFPVPNPSNRNTLIVFFK